ncbi:MAG: hypothetical protein GTN67_14610 [Hydrotalea flava]|nr:hypothetical protein [Hydrotalea flava]NIM36511.1 hypothetical protein [Hydrotalea flava]NIM39370.1 hypothetical protein [Hydrotalea flava]NIN04559.1 hypothetical protein [Hydrotalea flava]NIN16231.1 hypothetical protein [Hydrotalea flava]
MDSFRNQQLNLSWQFLTTPLKKWWNLNKSGLTIQLQPVTCSDLTNPSFLGWRQSHLKEYASTPLSFTTKNEKAGLLIFQNEHTFYYLCQSIENNEPIIQLFQAEHSDTASKIKLVASKK